MTSPMQVLEDTPKVWIVTYNGAYDDSSAESIHRTEEGAKEYVSRQADRQRWLTIDWEVLND